MLGLWQLTAIGLGGLIGVGIFVLTGVVAATQAGPAVSLSFVIAGVASAAAALCYAEFAGMIPAAGSAYTYAYAVLGELAAWIIGWDLLLEYALVVAVVSIGWSGYLQALLGQLGLALPVWASGAAGTGEGRIVDLAAMLGALGVAGAAGAAHRMGRALQRRDGGDQDRRGRCWWWSRDCRMCASRIGRPSCPSASAASSRARRSCSSRCSAMTR